MLDTKQENVVNEMLWKEDEDSEKLIEVHVIE